MAKKLSGKQFCLMTLFCVIGAVILLHTILFLLWILHPAPLLPGMELPDGEVIFEYDDHGGFQGDGQSLTILQFSDDSFLKAAAQAESWKGFPMEPECVELSTLFSGVSDKLQPFLDQAAAGTPAEGLYLFQDRFSEATDPYDAEAALTRYSYNFTLAIYDREARQLAVYKLDT